MNVVDVMSRSVLKIKPDITINEAAAIMIRNDHGMLVVVDTNDRMIGVITDKDILERVVKPSKPPESLTVQEIMTKHVITIEPSKSVSEAARVMHEQRTKRLPVVLQEKLVGVISSTDILSNMLQAKKDLLDMALRF